MADFDLEGEFAPDSDLDSDPSQSAVIVLNDGLTCTIYKNDWIDALEYSVPPDPYWGYAFQISRIDGNDIYIKIGNADGVYEETGMSPENITNVYRHVEKS
jgi:hypothetical protein